MPHSKISERPRFVSGWISVDRLPLLLGGDAQDRVAEVAVLAPDVGEGVVLVVVGLLPRLGRGGVVPLPRRGVDLRVAHPVPLAVQDVVPDLHVVEDLGHRQRGGADQPRGREPGEQQRGATADLQAALHRDDALDVAGVGLAERVHHLGAQRVELHADGVDLLGGEVGGELMGLLPDEPTRATGASCVAADVTVMRISLQVDLDVARCAGDAGLDELARGVVEVAGAQVAHGAGAQSAHACVADAHAASAGQQRSGGLAGGHAAPRPGRRRR